MCTLDCMFMYYIFSPFFIFFLEFPLCSYGRAPGCPPNIYPGKVTFSSNTKRNRDLPVSPLRFSEMFNRKDRDTVVFRDGVVVLLQKDTLRFSCFTVLTSYYSWKEIFIFYFWRHFSSGTLEELYVFVPVRYPVSSNLGPGNFVFTPFLRTEYRSTFKGLRNRRKES